MKIRPCLLWPAWPMKRALQAQLPHVPMEIRIAACVPDPVIIYPPPPPLISLLKRPCPVSTPFPIPLNLRRSALHAGGRRLLQDQRDRAVDFTFQGSQLVFDDF